MNIDFSLLPWALRVEVSENLCRKGFNQVELAKIQRQLIGELAKTIERSNRGAREESSCTEYSVRRENVTEKVAKFFGESERTIRKRFALTDAASEGSLEAKDLLKRIDSGAITLSRGYNEILRVQRKEELAKADLSLPDGKFRLLYADPAWEFSNSGFSTSASNHYPTMPIEEIAALPVADLAFTDCVLLLWAVNALLPEALRIISEWGFVYKTNYVWTKNRGLPGFHHISQHELLLVATKGRCFPTGNLVPSVINAPRQGHSRKPELYGIIESLYHGPYLELFARNRESRSGWTFWGNQATAEISPAGITDISKSSENIAE